MACPDFSVVPGWHGGCGAIILSIWLECSALQRLMRLLSAVRGFRLFLRRLEKSSPSSSQAKMQMHINLKRCSATLKTAVSVSCCDNSLGSIQVHPPSAHLDIRLVDTL